MILIFSNLDQPWLPLSFLDLPKDQYEFQQGFIYENFILSCQIYFLWIWNSDSHLLVFHLDFWIFSCQFVFFIIAAEKINSKHLLILIGILHWDFKAQNQKHFIFQCLQFRKNFMIIVFLLALRFSNLNQLYSIL